MKTDYFLQDKKAPRLEGLSVFDYFFAFFSNHHQPTPLNKGFH